MKSNGVVGVFDSGVGGLSVLRHIRAVLPAEDIVYVADSAHAPYGDKPTEFITARSMAIMRFLRSRGAKAAVVACNTATAAAADSLRKMFDMPIVAMEPGVKPAAAASRSGVVGVMATRNTLLSSRFEGLLRRFARDADVLVSPCPGLVERIESGDADSTELKSMVASFVCPMVVAGADVVVLGCTHYPFVAHWVRHSAGPDAVIIDTGPAVARQLLRRLSELHSVRLDDGHQGEVELFTTGDPNGCAMTMRRLCPELPPPKPMPI